MKRSSNLAQLMSPWAGLILGVLAVAFVHQFGSDSTFDKCAAVVPGPVLAVAAVGLLVCAASGFISWRSLRGEDIPSRRVVAVISVGCTAVLGLAILLPMIATLMLPPCFG